MMPTRVIPICTVERNLPGSAASASAVFAPLLPRSASSRRRAGRAETIAISDSEKTPLMQDQPRDDRQFIPGKGATIRR